MTQKNDFQIPEWMKQQNDYSPAKDKDGFITRTMLSLLKLFRHFQIEKNENLSQAGAGFRTLFVLGIIFLTALSHNLFFCGTVAASFLLVLSFSKIEILKKVLATAITAALFTVLIMLPSFFLYKSMAVITITGKVFLSTGLLSLFALTTPWNKITSALSFIKIPGFIVFILDLTIHYILILGNVAYEMLFALKLRSVGKNKNKRESFSGILGSVFLKSIAVTQETQQAMECRLFNGTYYHTGTKFNIKDFLPLIVLILYIVLFIL